MKVYVLTHIDKKDVVHVIGVYSARVKAGVALALISKKRKQAPWTLFITPCVMNEALPA